MQLTDKQIHLLSRLRVHEPELQELLQIFRDRIYRQMEVTSNTEELHALRGEARAYSELLASIDGSREASERLEAQRKAGRS